MLRKLILSKRTVALLSAGSITIATACASSPQELYEVHQVKATNLLKDALKDVENNKKSIINRLPTENNLGLSEKFNNLVKHAPEGEYAYPTLTQEVNDYVPKGFKQGEYNRKVLSEVYDLKENDAACVYATTGALGCVFGTGIFFDGIQKGSVTQGCFGLTAMGASGLFLYELYNKSQEGKVSLFISERNETIERQEEFSSNIDPAISKRVTKTRVVKRNRSLSGIREKSDKSYIDGQLIEPKLKTD